MEPGDMIEWVYNRSGDLVDGDENLWSSVEERLVPVGSEMIHLLISINDETYSWMNERGLFHARVDDSSPGSSVMMPLVVVPRARG